MMLEGTMLYYCVGTTVPGFNVTDNNVTVTMSDLFVETDDTISSSDGVTDLYGETYTLTFECSRECCDIDGIISLLNNIAQSNKQIRKRNQHFKWLSKHHTSMCKLKNGFRHKNHWNRIRSRCWVSSPSANLIMALAIILVII